MRTNLYHLLHVGAVTWSCSRAAYDRWGCDQFYVDSTSFDFVPPFSSVKLMPGSVWQKVHEALPDVLFIPETTAFDAVPYVAPLRNDWSHAAQGSGAAMVRSSNRRYD